MERDTANAVRPTCSVIIPVFNESDNLAPLREALCGVAACVDNVEWEFLFVEDGSTDDTFVQLKEQNRTDPRFKVVRLSRNHGSHAGAAAGLDFATGDVAVVMAGDMQEHPREISRLIDKWREGFDVVVAVRASRRDHWKDRVLARLFARFIRRVALPNYPLNGSGSFCLLDRSVINALNAFPERNRMTFGMILSAGFRHTQIEYDRLQRHSGRSKWSFGKKLKHVVDTVVSFSSLPIRMISITGLVMAALSFVYAAYIAIDATLHDRQVEGWATIVVLILLIGGLQLFVLGILGEYIWRISDEVRRRPLFLVKELVGEFPRMERRVAAKHSAIDVIREQLLHDRNHDSRR